MLKIILVFVVILLLVGGGAYYLGTLNQSSNQTTVVSSDQVSPNPQATASASVQTNFSGNKRLFNPADTFFVEEKYPVALTSISENALQPVSCSAVYSSYDDGYNYSDPKEAKKAPPMDSKLKQYLDSLNLELKNQKDTKLGLDMTGGEKHVTEIMNCSTQKGTNIVLYSVGPCGGGCSGIPYVAVDTGSGLKTIADFTKFDEGMAYFGCRRGLQFTNTDLFYFQCSGGDGGGASASIYVTSLKDNSLSRIRHCESYITEELGADGMYKSNTTCSDL